MSIERQDGLIWIWTVADVGRRDGAQLIGPIDQPPTVAAAWADTAYPSKRNDTWLTAQCMRSWVHRKEPQGWPTLRWAALANGRTRVRSAIEHVFARQNGPLGLLVRTIGLAPVATRGGLALLACNMQRLAWPRARAASG